MANNGKIVMKIRNKIKKIRVIAEKISKIWV